MSDCRLTTFDNPFDPFEQFASWYLFDCEKGHYTCSKLARIAQVTDDMSEVEVQIQTEKAIDELIALDFENKYKKVYRNNTNVQEETPKDQ